MNKDSSTYMLVYMALALLNRFHVDVAFFFKKNVGIGPARRHRIEGSASEPCLTA